MDSSLNCKHCNKPYNMVSREPLSLPCCGNGICRGCIIEMFNPQDNTYQCPYCQTDNNSEVELKPIVPLKNLIEKQSPIGIQCHNHLNKQAEHFCKKHQLMLCTGCAMQDHGSHNKEVVKLNCLQYSIFCDQFLKKLKLEKERISTMIDSFSGYIDRDKTFQSQEFLKLTKEGFEVIRPKVISKEDIRNLEYLGNYTKKRRFCGASSILRNFKFWIAIVILTVYFRRGEKSEPKFAVESKLIQSQEENTLINNWIGNEPYLHLIYRGTRDGFGDKDFHNRCDNQGETISVIKSERGQIFGGYTSVSWSSNAEGIWKSDPKAFIFSLTKKSKHIQYRVQDQSVFHIAKDLMIFGGGNDIAISDNSHTSGLSNAKLGHTYQLPDSISPSTKEANSYLGGAETFKVLEIEVFKVFYK